MRNAHFNENLYAALEDTNDEWSVDMMACGISAQTTETFQVDFSNSRSNAESVKFEAIPW